MTNLQLNCTIFDNRALSLFEKEKFTYAGRSIEDYGILKSGPTCSVYSVSKWVRLCSDSVSVWIFWSSHLRGLSLSYISSYISLPYKVLFQWIIALVSVNLLLWHIDNIDSALQGLFEILSLSGSYLLTESDGSRTKSGGLTITLSGPDGRVLGGILGGVLIASTSVQVRPWTISG